MTQSQTQEFVSNGTDTNGYGTQDQSAITDRPENQEWNNLGAAFTETTSTQSSDWLGNARVYEWQDDYGDIVPRIPELEEHLFNSATAVRVGKHREVLDIEVRVEGPDRLQPMRKFEEAGLHPVIVENIQLCKYDVPMPIQSYIIPAVLSGHDVVGISQTGSGKTAAYLIPALSKLAGKRHLTAFMRRKQTKSRLAEPLIVVLVPNRELAIQIFDEARRLCYRTGLRPCVAYGGSDMAMNLNQLAEGCDVLIATPGRLTDLMKKPDVLTMSRVKYTIIDEADELLTSDWEEEFSMIMAGGDTNEDADHVYMMFSATFPSTARTLARQYMAQDHYRIRVGRPGQSHKNIRQKIIEIEHFKKNEAVYDLLTSMEPTRTLIFCNSRDTVDKVDDHLFNRGLPCTSIHSGRSQREREDAFTAFRTGKAPILIASGAGSRGWDVANVGHVINRDLPSTEHQGIMEYVHRIGRTGRMGNIGLATSFFADRDDGIAQDLVNCLVECECEVPEFLSHLAPQEGVINFDDDSDVEDAADNDYDALDNNDNDGEDGVDQVATDFAAARL